jgi:hypothetical protein
MQSNKGSITWLFNLIVKPTTKFLTILKILKTFVVSILTTAEAFILSMKRISTTTQVMCGEHLLIAIANIKRKIKGIDTNENMAS